MSPRFIPPIISRIDTDASSFSPFSPSPFCHPELVETAPGRPLFDGKSLSFPTSCLLPFYFSLLTSALLL